MPVVKFSNFEVDCGLRELRQAGVRVPLQHKPFRILELLLQNPGALVTRQELAGELWPGLHVNFDHSLNSAVNSLRIALGDSPRCSRFIETRSGLGYRFIAPLEESLGTSGKIISSSASGCQDYLKGRFFLNKMTPAGIQRAIGFFQSALNEDPDAALPLTGLADAHCQLSLSGTVRSADICHTAREFAAAALRAQPDLAEAHVSLGRLRMMLNWDWTGAAEAFNQALHLDPALPEAYRARALMFSALNRSDEALNDLRRAREADPLSLPIGYELAWVLYLSKRFEEAIAECWTVLSLDPGFFPAQHILGLAYGQLGSHEEAVTECQNACACSDRHPSALASLGYAYAASGDTNQAEQTLEELLALAQRQHVSPYFAALIQLGLDRHHGVVSSLESAFSQRDPLLLWLNNDPRFQTMRSNHAFVKLVGRTTGQLGMSAA